MDSGVYTMFKIDLTSLSVQELEQIQLEITAELMERDLALNEENELMAHSYTEQEYA